MRMNQSEITAFPDWIDRMSVGELSEFIRDTGRLLTVADNRGEENTAEALKHQMQLAWRILDQKKGVSSKTQSNY